MMVRGQWANLVRMPGLHLYSFNISLLIIPCMIVYVTNNNPYSFSKDILGFLMTTESQDLGLTSHPKEAFLLFKWIMFWIHDLIELFNESLIKGIFHPKMTILSLITHPHFIPHPKDLRSSLKRKQLLNKVIIFVFFAQKMYSHSFVKLRLNLWFHQKSEGE